MTTVINDDACIRSLGSGGGGSIISKRLVTYTDNFQLAIEDSNCIVEVDSPTPVICTVPKFSTAAFKVGTEFEIVQVGMGSVTLVPEDVTVSIEAGNLVLDRITSKGYLYHRNKSNSFVFSLAVSATGIPKGGTTEQALLKLSNQDGDVYWKTLTKASVGLSNVDNTSDLNKPVSVDQAAADTSTLNSAKAYTDAMTTGLLQFIGNWSASSGLYPTTGGSGAAGAVVIGDVWRVSVAGTMGGVTYRIGDSFYATSDTPAQDPTKWASILLELGYNPEDVANKVTAFSSPTNAQYPSALLVKTQLDLKLDDVTNGTGTGVTQVRTPSTGIREIAKLVGANTDVVITQGVAGAPNTVGLVGTTLKYWEEASSAHPSNPTDTELLTFRPKVIAPYTLANTVMNIPVKKGITLRDPLETGGTFPTLFTTGLDLQIKGTTGTNVTYARGGYCFGEGNLAGTRSTCIGVDNQAGGMSTAAVNSILVGKGNRSSAFADSATAIGVSNTAGTYAVAVGKGNAATDNCIAVGVSNQLNGNYTINIGFGVQNVNSGIGSSSNILLGIGNSSANQGYSILLGNAITATAPNSIVIASKLSPNVLPTDQGINGFTRLGRKAVIPINYTLTGITDFANAAWRDVVGTTLLSIDGSGSANKFSASFLVRFTTFAGAGIPAIVTRVGVMKLEFWRTGTDIPTIKVLEGGDADFLTYFDFQLVASGTGAKLQYKLVSDPTGGSPNSAQILFNGNLSIEVSSLI